MVVALHGVAASADPAAPQVAPIHLQREDSQRIRDQQRSLDDATASAPIAIAARPPAPVEVYSATGAHVAGGILLGVAGISALASLTYFSLNASTPSTSFDGTPNQNDYGTIGAVLLITSLLAGATGFVLVTRRSTVQLAPTATHGSVGLAITGAL